MRMFGICIYRGSAAPSCELWRWFVFLFFFELNSILLVERNAHIMSVLRYLI